MVEMFVLPCNRHRLMSCHLLCQQQPEADIKIHLTHLKSNLFLLMWQNLGKYLQQLKHKDKFQATHRMQSILL